MLGDQKASLEAHMVKNLQCNAEDLGSMPLSGRSPGGRHGNQLQYSCLENPHGQRSLVGYSPWGHKELDTTEQLNTAQHRGPETDTEYKCLLKSLYFRKFKHYYC